MPLILIVSVAAAIALAGQSPEPSQQPANSRVSAEKPWPPAGVHRANDPGVIPPRLIKEVRPNYTAAAMGAKITGAVILEAVVGVDGRITDVRITKSLDRVNGLDKEALRTVKQWEFEPATKDGVRIPALVEIEMTFSLRK